MTGPRRLHDTGTHVVLSPSFFKVASPYCSYIGPGNEARRSIGRFRLFNPRMGLFGKVGKRQTMLCGSAIAAARFVSGGVSGHLYVWKGR